MGGPAEFEGATYQEGVIAFIFVHALAERRLGWIDSFDDQPRAVSGETGGPGDDVLVEAAGGDFELQAKAGLTGDAAFADAMRGIVGRYRGRPEPVVLAVDRRSSRWVYNEAATELDRLRGGRSDVLSKLTTLHAELGSAIHPIRAKALDVLPPDSLEADRARDLLAGLLESDAAASAAWSRLLEMAADVARRRQRRTRDHLVAALALLDIVVPELGPNARWLNQLEFARGLLDKRHAAAALTILADVERRLPGTGVSAEVRYWLWKHRATAQVQLRLFDAARASAATALDVRPQGVEALAVAALAAVRAGNIELGRDAAKKAIAADGANTRGWTALAEVEATAGDPISEPPARVAEAPVYRTVLAEIALAAGDAARTEELTAALLADGERSPEILFLRAAAIQQRARDAQTRRVVATDEIERLAGEAIEGFEDVHPLKARALVVRAANRQAAGDLGGATVDGQLAADLAGGDPSVIRNLVGSRLAAGDLRSALTLLLGPQVEEDSLLLGLRAGVRAELGDRLEADEDLALAFRRVADAPDADLARLAVADAAIGLGNAEVATAAMAGLSDEARRGLSGMLVSGRIAFAGGRSDEGAQCYRAAAGLAGADRVEVLKELAGRLVTSGRNPEAVAVFEEIGGSPLPDELLHAKVKAYWATGDLQAAQDQIDVLGESRQLPAWALGTAVDIALARDDTPTAIEHLRRLIEGGHATPSVRLTLARELIGVGMEAEATEQVEAIALDPSLGGRERMGLAELMVQLGRGEDSLHQALPAFRAAREDPDVNRALVALVFGRHLEIPPPNVVAADTHVRLVDAAGQSSELTLLAEPPFDVSRDEVPLDAPVAQAVLDKIVGDEVVEHPESSWQRRVWRVEEIVPAIVHFARDVLVHYEQRFGPDPFFVATVHVGDGSGGTDFTKIIQALSERRAHVEQAFALHREQGLPLGLVSRQIGTSIPDLMDAAATLPDRFGQVAAEWSVGDLLAWSVSQAEPGRTVVIARSAIRTVRLLSLRAAVAESFNLVAPRSLLHDLGEDLARATSDLEHGSSTMWASEAGIGGDEIPAGHEVLKARLEAIRDEQDWVHANVSVEPRPFASLSGSPLAGIREFVGHESYDALALASLAPGRALFADDLGLRRLSTSETRIDSFSTVALVIRLGELGILSAATRDEALVKLVRFGYAAVPPSPSLLVAGLHTEPALQAVELERLFGTLVNQAVSHAEAVRIAALACRGVVLVRVRRSTPRRVAELALPHLASRLPRRAAALLLEAACADTLALLPGELAAVREVCQAFQG